ncbi:DUF4258 domain-containing protein [Psychroflexus salis]|uniref:DUF4258 domain-containing protein n=1 Tax=Psychroflexus salis TaxID=1526574 RepID=A0A916ZPL9_9FLAO|nr:DUF4258 domain-containing protein [Psychroflexus salis]GGE07884.1 hypothetical protein GCM10010831_06800 [Psychroflexus salis]
MKFIQRFAYYSIGLGIGIVFLLFFLSGKKTSCDYGLDARVKKNIRIKKREITKEAELQFKVLQIDTASISSILANGNVDFKKSDTKLDSCKMYYIQGKYEHQELAMLFENCDSVARVQEVSLIN